MSDHSPSNTRFESRSQAEPGLRILRTRIEQIGNSGDKLRWRERLLQQDAPTAVHRYERDPVRPDSYRVVQQRNEHRTASLLI